MESNAFWPTVRFLARMLGSPIVAMSYSFWNIRISAQAASIVDMSVPYKELPGPGTDFAHIRDSFYLLLMMNQFEMKPKESLKREAEGLLRIVLFSKDLRLLEPGQKLNDLRVALAQEFREFKQGGAVSAFISQVCQMVEHTMENLSLMSDLTVLVHVRNGRSYPARCVDNTQRPRSDQPNTEAEMPLTSGINILESECQG